jgi:hypothetical protein
MSCVCVLPHDCLWIVLEEEFFRHDPDDLIGFDLLRCHVFVVLFFHETIWIIELFHLARQLVVSQDHHRRLYSEMGRENERDKQKMYTQE